jgi:hypothetical protein
MAFTSIDFHLMTCANTFAPHPNENRPAACATGQSLWFIAERAAPEQTLYSIDLQLVMIPVFPEVSFRGPIIQHNAKLGVKVRL